MTDSTVPQDKSSNNHHARNVAMTWMAIIFLGIAIIWFFYWLFYGRFHEYTDDAYVNGNIVQLMPQITGTVVAINTDDTQYVEQGEVVIKLDATDREIALQRAQAALGQATRQVRQYFESAQQAQSVLIARQADLMKAQADLSRRTGLVGERAVSREELQHYTTAVKTTQAQYDSALHNLKAAMSFVENSHLYTNPIVERAKANFKSAYIDLQRTTIVAPVRGYVAKRNVQLGQQVSMSTPMLAIIPLDQVWVDANYKESQLDNLRVGQPVELKADAYSAKYHGKVYGLSAGTGAAFALLPPQNATGNWIKIVQRLPVRISLNPNELKKAPLQIGLSMRVTTDTHDVSGNNLSQRNANQPIYSTHVYADQLKNVDQLITSILEDNAQDMYLPPLSLPTSTS